MGGGLAAPTRATAEILDLDAYAAILARHLGPLGVTVAIEPGEYFTTDAGVLLAEVVTVEDRSAAGDGSAVFAGLDCGWNVMNIAFVYHEPMGVVLCRAADAPATRRYTVSSHINEGPDIFAEDRRCRRSTRATSSPSPASAPTARPTGTGTACGRSRRSSGSTTAADGRRAPRPRMMDVHPRSVYCGRGAERQGDGGAMSPEVGEPDERIEHPNRGTLGQPPMGGGDHLYLSAAPAARPRERARAGRRRAKAAGRALLPSSRSSSPRARRSSSRSGRLGVI